MPLSIQASDGPIRSHRLSGGFRVMPFNSDSVQSILLLSLRVSGTATLISALLGVPLGTWIGLSRSKWRWILTSFVHTGMALPPVVAGLFLYVLLSRSGPLGAFGWLFTPRAMIAAQICLAFPFVVGITMSAVSAVPEELAVQLRTLGASEAQCRWTILREARSGMLLSIAAAFGRSLSEVGAVLIVGGNIEGHTRVLTTAIVLETSKGNFDFALTLGVALLLVAFAVNAAMVRWCGGRVLA